MDALNTGEKPPPQDLSHESVLVEGPSEKGYRIGFYLEHLEEASFLYEQRLALLNDPELTWPDLHEFEERFEAHIDALVLGEELALAVCRQQAREGDFGELHAAVRVFCRQNRLDLFHEVVELLDSEDDERVQAIADALCHELPADWQQDIENRPAEEGSALMRVAARALGYRRIPASDPLIRALGEASSATVPDIIWSLGRLRDPGARPVLYKTYLKHEPAGIHNEPGRIQNEQAEIQSAAALALLRIGEPAAIEYCAGVARSQPWALLPIGLGGGKAHLGLLMDVASSDGVSTECMLALGLLGDIAAVDPLLYHLGDEPLAEHAATALYLITGAELFEEVFIPEEIDEDELFEDELEELHDEGNDAAQSNEDNAAAQDNENNAVPQEDAARGTTISRLSQQPEVWQEWWEQNKAKFKSGVRYRIGRPYSPEAILETLSAERSPRIVRSLAAEELVIRYGFDLRLETDMFVAQQRELLSSAGGWLERQRSRFDDGKYYLAGRIQSR